MHFLISVLYLSRKYTYEEGKSMFSNLKRKSVTRSLFGIILCIVFGIVLIVFQFGNIQSLLKGPVMTRQRTGAIWGLKYLLQMRSGCLYIR